MIFRVTQIFGHIDTQNSNRKCVYIGCYLKTITAQPRTIVDEYKSFYEPAGKPLLLTEVSPLQQRSSTVIGLQWRRQDWFTWISAQSWDHESPKQLNDWKPKWAISCNPRNGYSQRFEVRGSHVSSSLTSVVKVLIARARLEWFKLPHGKSEDYCSRPQEATVISVKIQRRQHMPLFICFIPF